MVQLLVNEVLPRYANSRERDTTLEDVMPGKSKRIPRTCEHCTSTFMALAWEVNRGNGRFCSRACFAESQRSSVEDALQNYVANPVTGCWEYRGAKDGKGYAVLGITRAGRHTYTRLSREVLKRSHGVDISDTKTFACHTCDTPLCIRPEHIFPGSSRANTDDMVAKGRQTRGERHASITRPESRPRGERHCKAKITADDVQAIRAEYASGTVKQVDLAQRYGLPQSSISAIVLRKTWKHVA